MSSQAAAFVLLLATLGVTWAGIVASWWRGRPAVRARRQVRAPRRCARQLSRRRARQLLREAEASEAAAIARAKASL